MPIHKAENVLERTDAVIAKNNCPLEDQMLMDSKYCTGWKNYPCMQWTTLSGPSRIVQAQSSGPLSRSTCESLLCAFRTSTGMHRMLMYREIMAVPPLSALVICQWDLHWDRWAMSHLRNASHNVHMFLKHRAFMYMNLMMDASYGSCFRPITRHRFFTWILNWPPMVLKPM